MWMEVFQEHAHCRLWQAGLNVRVTQPGVSAVRGVN
jgi:hypothetical protein